MRHTSDEINLAILDTAARTFAMHGYAKTSIQQLADAVGYSKTGLLHRFASKQVLYSAVVDHVRAAVEEVLAQAEHVPAGEERSAAVLGLIATKALSRPGLVQLLMEAIRPASEEPERDGLHALALRVVDTVADGDTEQRLRAVLACKLILNAMQMQTDEILRIDRARLHPLIVSLATGVLGVSRSG